jgi:lipopolysaccharide transport protein LptA
VELQANEVTAATREHRVTAVGNPVLKHPRGTLAAEKIWFELEPQTNDVRVVRAEGSVRMNAAWENRQTAEGQAERAQFLRGEERIVLEGNVRLTQNAPELESPRSAAGSTATVDLKTRRVSIRGQGGGVGQAEIRVPNIGKSDKEQARANPDR